MTQKKNFLFLVFGALFIFLVENVSAHCPLCTIGAGAAAAGAVWLGISKVVIGLFIGGFSMSMGLWMSNLVKKKYFRFQKELIVLTIFLLTLLPLLPIFSAIGPIHLPFLGEYGKTYALNYSLISGLFGGMIVFSSPKISKEITKKRNGKRIPFQGTILTIVLLIIAGLIIQFGILNTSSLPSEGSTEKLSPEEFEKIIQTKEVFVLNVHTPYYGKINRTDLIIEDWQNIEKYLDKIPDKSIPIALYCRSGSMSSEVAEKLKDEGYQIYELEGGMNAWVDSGRTLIE